MEKNFLEKRKRDWGTALSKGSRTVQLGPPAGPEAGCQMADS